MRRATAEQNYCELDFTLGLPIRYGMGFMLGGHPIGLYGLDNPQAFGHLGFTNMFAWADPKRQISAALLTSGKPIISLHVVRLLQLLFEIARLPQSPVSREYVPPLEARARARRKRRGA